MAGVKGAGNFTFTYNTNDLTDYVEQFQLQQTVAELENTNMGSTAQSFVPGLASYQASLDLTNWDSTLDGYLAPDVITPGTKRTAVIEYTDADGGTVTYTWTNEAFLTNYSIQASPSDLIKAPGASIRLNGAPNRSVTQGGGQ